MKPFVLALALFTISLGLSGCAALAGILPIVSDVISYLEEGEEQLNKIDSAVRLWFAAHPDEEAQKKYGEAMGTARSALAAMMSVSKGAEKASQSDVDAAAAEFKKAYTALITVLTDLGFGVTAGGESLSASRDGRPTIELAIPADRVVSE